MLNTLDVLDQLGPRLADDVRDSQSRKNLRASGRSAASVRHLATQNGRRAKLQLLGSAYFRFQQNGRGPNRSGKPSREMVDALRDWTKRRGLPVRAAYPIALNIARKGIKVPNPYNPGGVLSDVLNRKRIVGLLKPPLKAQLVADVRSLIFA
ncbi:hypothetical protein DYU11_22635 [Fibrisoma montanum]|uniref:Uncharacterized protein n=1 Tax=Fibrisoma montanum TaxID=2305895 RepID=A0A418M2F2_9BACT|nr:hypothetical protein [Fibrisoma montanum]RIV19729.1 hypothetical protein DYU11_22635 [Fibrisoma montanum]